MSVIVVVVHSVANIIVIPQFAYMSIMTVVQTFITLLALSMVITVTIFTILNIIYNRQYIC